MALGADDPLLFGSRLIAQYALARDANGFSDAQLADLARDSIRASRAPEETRLSALREVDHWLAGPEPLSPAV